MQRLTRILGSLGNVAELVLDIIVFILAFSSIWLFCFLVFMRYVVGIGYDWGDELVQAMIITAMILAAAGVVRQEGHTSIDFLANTLRRRKHVILLTVQHIISVAGCGLLVWAGILIVAILKAKGLTSTSSIPIPFWLLYAMLPIAIFFCGFYYLEKLVQKIQQLVSGSSGGESL